MAEAGFKTRMPALLDRALIGLLIFVVLVLLGMEMIMTGSPPVS